LIHLALERAGASADEAVEIGDTAIDEETAHAAGVRCIRADRLGAFAELLELVA
jgi:phosphoglycolate phosphatase-like HAD superfamily hydrolase